MIYLLVFMPIGHKLSLPVKKGSWENHYCGWYYPVLAVLGDVGKNVEQAMSKQTRRQHSSLASVSLPASKFLPWAPSLTALDIGYVKI